MSATKNMKGLPYVPLDPAWLAESPAFASSDARLVRAVVRLLTHAWVASPPGTVPIDFGVLSNITQLTPAEVGEHHDDLFHGWSLVDGRLQFPPMHSLCARIHVRYADVLTSISDQGAAIVQGPEEFELTAPEIGSPIKGKRRLPKDWRLGEHQRAWLLGNGFSTIEDQDFVAEKFVTHYQSKGELMLDWEAAFKNFALKENRAGLPSRRSSSIPAFSPHSRAARFGAAGQQARDHNEDAFQRAASRLNEGGARV